MKKQSLVILGAIFFLSSCSHYYYAPNTHNVPVFAEKNEVHLSGALTASDKFGGEIQAGYAMTDHGAVIANACLIQPNADKNINNGNGYLYEIGGGYFRPMRVENRRFSDRLVFEVYGIAGLGGYRNYYWNEDAPLTFPGDTQQFYYPKNYIETRFIKVYAQPSVAYSHDIVDVILSAKIGFLDNYQVSSTIPMAVLNTAGISEAGSLVNDWRLLHSYPSSFLFEPAFTLRLGYKYIKAQAQLSWSVINTSPFFYNLGIPFTISLGLSVDLAPRYGIIRAKKKKQMENEDYPK